MRRRSLLRTLASAAVVGSAGCNAVLGGEQSTTTDRRNRVATHDCVDVDDSVVGLRLRNNAEAPDVSVTVGAPDSEPVLDATVALGTEGGDGDSVAALDSVACTQVRTGSRRIRVGPGDFRVVRADVL